MPVSIRQKLREQRRSLSSTEREKFSQQIANNLAGHLPFRKAQRIALYMSTDEEVDTWPVIELAQSLDQEIFLPVVNTQRWRGAPLLFYQYLPGATPMRKNRFGINEPVSTASYQARIIELDLVCVPMVGFNDRCDRIGMGAGYYDRTFSKEGFREHHLVGLAFSCQQASFSPADHDVPMNVVVTESAILRR